MRGFLIAFLLLLFFSAPAFAGDAEAYSGRFSLVGDEYAISYADGHISIDSMYLSAGEIGRFGLLRTISDPYSSAFSLKPETSVRYGYGRQSGVVAGTDALSAGFSLGGRPLAFAYSGSEYIEGALLFAFPGAESEGGYLINDLSSSGASMLYAGISGGWEFFRLTGIASFSPETGFTLFGAAGLYWERYSVYVIGGDTVPVHGERSPRTWGVRVTIGEPGFRSDISVAFGSHPVYSSDFLPVRASIRSELEMHGLRIYSSMEYSFSAKGRVHKRDRIAFHYMGFTLGYDTSSGAIASYSHDLFEVGYEDGKVYAEVELDLGRDGAEAEIRLSSDGSVDTALSIAL